jgi:RimJ/RimL family protein N-acetyltransferase
MNTSVPDPIFLKGKKVSLRPLGLQDVPFLLRWVNDPINRQYIIRYTPVREKEEREWVEGSGKNNSSVTLGITVKGKLIGSLGFHEINWKDRNADIGIMIGDSRYREKGYGSDAARTLVEYGFNTLNLHKLVWKAVAFNDRSVNCAKKCGFSEEGRLREFVFKNGQYFDEVILSVLREEWLAKEKKGKSKPA